jgi:hypothetical protein
VHALYALAGMPVMALFVPPLTVLQSTVADAYRGRVFDAIGATTTLTVVVGLGIGSILGPFASSVLFLDLSAALYSSAVVAFWR